MTTPDEKAAVVRELCDSIRDSIIAQIPRMPAEWNAHELRELLAENFRRERSTLMMQDRARFRQFVTACGYYNIR